METQQLSNIHGHTNRQTIARTFVLLCTLLIQFVTAKQTSYSYIHTILDEFFSKASGLIMHRSHAIYKAKQVRAVEAQRTSESAVPPSCQWEGCHLAATERRHIPPLRSSHIRLWHQQAMASRRRMWRPWQDHSEHPSTPCRQRPCCWTIFSSIESHPTWPRVSDPLLF